MDSEILEESENAPSKIDETKEVHKNSSWTYPVFLIKAVILYEYTYVTHTSHANCVLCFRRKIDLCET